MKINNSKLFFIGAVSLVGVFAFLSILLFTPTKVVAQGEEGADTTIEEISVFTTGYSVLSSNVFILEGAYAGNVAHRPFTTYFEYKRNDSDLDDSDDRQETIKIVRNDNVGESAEFQSSPSLQLSSDYYFRAVGYFNDTPEERFYGSVASFRTGFPFIADIPFTFRNTGPGSACQLELFCPIPVTSNMIEQGNTVIPYTPRANPNPSDESDTESTPDTTPDDSTTTTPVPEANTGGETEDELSSFGALVQCDGENCDFVEFMKLINRVIKFIFVALALPIAAIMFAYAGFLMLTSGGSSESKTKARNIFTNAVIGLAVAAGAWLIVRTLLSILGYDGAWIFLGF